MARATGGSHLDQAHVICQAIELFPSQPALGITQQMSVDAQAMITGLARAIATERKGWNPLHEFPGELEIAAQRATSGFVVGSLGCAVALAALYGLSLEDTSQRICLDAAGIITH